MINPPSSVHFLATRSAFIWTRLLNVPFWVLLNLLPVILYKDLKISPWLVTLMIVIKPASALLASYWGAWLNERQDRLVSNLVWGNILRYLPFLFIPWIHSAGYMIVAFGFYMMLNRGVIPAWMEIFKINLESHSRSRIFSYGSAIDYTISAIFPLAMGFILDDYAMSWRLLFPLSAILGIFSTIFLLKLPSQITLPQPKAYSFKDTLLRPWAEAFKILKERSDFAHFQIGFMLGGAGLMVMQPMIPMIFVDILQLSYTEMLFAMAVCKAIGYAAASTLWVKLFDRLSIYTFCGFVSLLAFVFPLLVLSSQFHHHLIYVAYLFYGGMQAGSELGWHMSGPVFAKDKQSALYSMTNVLSVGIRGCVAPPLGSILFLLSNASIALLSGGALCLLSAFYLIRSPEKQQLSLD